MDQETRRLLQEADWSTIREDLMVHTIWQVGHYRWSLGGNLDLARGYTVEDVVHEVIVKALSGTRRWDRAKGPLLPWLKTQVRSVIDALAKSAAHRREECLPEMEGFSSPESLDPLRIILKEESEAHTRQKVHALFQAVEEKPELREVLRVIMEGCEPRPRCIALEVNIPVREVDNRLKRLRRCASRLAKDDLLQSH